MQKIIILLLLPFFSQAQLTVANIMKDPKWIGTSPSNIYWTYSSKQLFFNWNPEKQLSDSSYNYTLSSKKINKSNYNDALLAEDISNGSFNTVKTAIAFIHDNDVFLLKVSTGALTRITSTEAGKSNVFFTDEDSSVAYNMQGNLFAWNQYTGTVKQLTNFVQGAAPEKPDPSQQQTFLTSDALANSAVLKRRSDKADSAKAFRESHKEEQLRTIYTGDSEVAQLLINSTGRFITFNFVKNAEDHNTVIPNYVTKNGYTTTFRSRSKVGRPDDQFAAYIYDRVKDTVLKIMVDSLPGMYDRPEYLKNYPDTNKDAKPVLRKVIVQGIYWNDEGTQAVADVFSLDYKDRWIAQLNPETGNLTLADRQHDSAWIAGPGIAWLDGANIGWLNEHKIYFQSEVSGYSHLYAYNFTTHERKAITSGNYEVQKVILSKNKKYFYIITNEEHPGKQNIYRINADGSNKIKLTSLTGGYEMFLSPDEKTIAYRYSYQTKPWELYYQTINPNTKPIQVTDEAASDEFTAYHFRDTKIFTFTARDSAQVYARIYEPKPGTKNNAAVIFVHGAGYLQNVDYAWSYYFREMMFNNLLADEGFTVMDIDYRASAGYGRNWRTAIYRYMGGKDLDDEVDAAHYLARYLNIDSTRIGMYGGSYGGFMTLMALFTQPDVFKAGAALRPVTDWAHYDHEYTAAILNKPSEDSLAYARSSPINFAAGLKNHLLICHGMVDDNVHFQDAVRLTQKLIELGKDNWQIEPYPVEDHGFIEPGSWTDEYKRVLKLFNDNLVGK